LFEEPRELAPHGGMTKQRRRKWAKHVAAWRASGLSSEEYGPKLGVTGRCVRRWEQKLKAGRPRRRVEKPRLMRVEVVAAPPPERPVVVSVGGRRVEVLSGFSKSTLAAVLEVVEVVEAKP
jgi:hypothetical protein